MSKNNITNINNSYQQVAAGAMVLTISKKGSGVLYIDEASNDATAYATSDSAGEQFQQTEALPTFIRATGAGWEVIVDGVL